MVPSMQKENHLCQLMTPASSSAGRCQVETAAQERDCLGSYCQQGNLILSTYHQSNLSSAGGTSEEQ